MRRVPHVFIPVIVVAALAVSACSGGGGAAATTTTEKATTTTRRTTTTSSSTTTTVVLPVPAPPPAPNAPEPVVQLGTIEIPKINISKTLYEGVTLTTLNRGPGHWPGTAMPGHSGNVVVGGHRTSKDKPFRYIDQLVPGDEVIFTTPEGRFVYEVNRTEVVWPTDVWIIDQTPSATATLFACTPVGSTAQRIVVFLDLVQ